MGFEGIETIDIFRQIHKHDNYNRIRWAPNRIKTWYDVFKNNKMIWDVSNKKMDS